MDHSLKFPAFSTSKKRVIPSGKHFGNWKITIFMDKPSTNGQLSIAMLDYERLSMKKNDFLGKIDEPIFFPGTMSDFPLQFVVPKTMCQWGKNPWYVLFSALKNCRVAHRHIELDLR